MFIDDSKDFLLNFSLQLDPSIAFKLYHSPFTALDTIHSMHQPEFLDKRCLSEYVDGNACPLNNYTVNLDLASIHCEIYNPRRFSEISVIVTDYAMPGMNGVEFCKKMGSSPIKRILLTGKADMKDAVDAFNAGIIDLYIQKQSPNIVELINEGIANLQLRYFQQMSDVITRMLSVNTLHGLQDPAFIHLFNEIKNQHNIVEYYLIESGGSFLMLDGDAKPNYFIVKTEQDLDMYYEMALDHHAPEAILEQLKTGQKIPYFWQSSDYYQNKWDDWSTYLYPAQKLKGKNTYYYAYVNNPTMLGIQANKIFSYRSYLENMEVTVK